MKQEPQHISLYFLEHIFLPSVIYPDQDAPAALNPFQIGNFFPALCADVMQREKAEGRTDKKYTPADFAAVPMEIRDEHDGQLHFYVLCMNFPFAPEPAYHTLCPRAYLVHGPQGEDPRYYTIEYDKDTKGYMLCCWQGENHLNLGPISADPKEQLQRVLHQEKDRSHASGAHSHPLH